MKRDILKNDFVVEGATLRVHAEYLDILSVEDVTSNIQLLEKQMVEELDKINTLKHQYEKLQVDLKTFKGYLNDMLLAGDK